MIKHKESEILAALHLFREKICAFSAPGAYSKYYRLDGVDSQINSMLSPKKLDFNIGKNTIRNPNQMDSAELNQCFYNGFFTCLDSLSFQIAIEKKQTPSTITKLNFVQTTLFFSQPDTNNRITGLSYTKSRYFDKRECLIDKDFGYSCVGEQ